MKQVSKDFLQFIRKAQCAKWHHFPSSNRAFPCIHVHAFNIVQTRLVWRHETKRWLRFSATESQRWQFCWWANLDYDKLWDIFQGSLCQMKNLTLEDPLVLQISLRRLDLSFAMKKCCTMMKPRSAHPLLVLPPLCWSSTSWTLFQRTKYSAMALLEGEPWISLTHLLFAKAYATLGSFEMNGAYSGLHILVLFLYNFFKTNKPLACYFSLKAWPNKLRSSIYNRLRSVGTQMVFQATKQWPLWTSSRPFHRKPLHFRWISLISHWGSCNCLNFLQATHPAGWWKPTCTKKNEMKHIFSFASEKLIWWHLIRCWWLDEDPCCTELGPTTDIRFKTGNRWDDSSRASDLDGS